MVEILINGILSGNMSIAKSIAVLWLVITLPNWIDSSTAYGNELPEPHTWQTNSACGPNALYELIIANNKACNYQDLYNFLDPPAAGSSLEELRVAGLSWGVNAAVYRGRRSSINSVRAVGVSQEPPMRCTNT